MSEKKQGFFAFLRKNQKKNFVFLCCLWGIIAVCIVVLIILMPYLLRKNNNADGSVVAEITVDALMVNQHQEKYLEGYKVSCHQADVSNVFKTPDVSTSLTSKGYLKFVYTISNCTNSQMVYDVDVIKNYQEKNLSITYAINSGDEKELSNDYVAGQISKDSTIKITFFVRIADNSLDADLSGEFMLNITYFADR